jgi:hypothetical protein
LVEIFGATVSIRTSILPNRINLSGSQWYAFERVRSTGSNACGTDFVVARGHAAGIDDVGRCEGWQGGRRSR